MPRIDPLQLLNCLSVLLRPDGGIRSESEVMRLASLMTKFSKKLVSKCIYVQILKRSDTRLLELFMANGGWALIHMWLSDGILNKNWALVQELLELLLLSPVDIEILKSNNCPKLIKGLSRDESQEGVRLLAGKLVEQWLRLVKGEAIKPVEGATDEKKSIPDLVDCPRKVDESDNSVPLNTDIPSETDDALISNPPSEPATVKTVEEPMAVVIEINDNSENVSGKVAEKEQVLNEKLEEEALPETTKSVNPLSNEDEPDTTSSKNTVPKEPVKSKEKKEKQSSNSHSPKSSRYSSKRSSGSSSHHKDKERSSKDRDKDRDKRSGSKSSTRDRDRDKDKDKEREKDRDKDKEKEKERAKAKYKQEEKDKATLDKLKPKTLPKLGKIPKKSSSDEKSNGKSDDKSLKPDNLDDKPNRAELKKPSISIEVRKSEGNRPKTVKTFNSKFRSHGLEEEAKPPPPRSSKKSSNTILPTIPPPPKRLSPPPRYDNMAPPEKVAKIAEAPVQAKPGAIKLIPPKPKPSLLMESDMFMDALSASASNKKEPRKRKRKLSASKEAESETIQPAALSSPTPARNQKMEETTDVNATTQNDKSEEEIDIPAPPRFYQDTLETTDEEKDSETEKEQESLITASVPPEIASPSNSESEKDNGNSSFEIVSEDNCLPLKGVLINTKRKGPKKKLQWRAEEELVDIQYFELDETERVNVTKTFTDMKQMERVNEREAFQLARKLPNEDTMEERTSWMILIPIDDVPTINFGKSSREKEIQYARERTVPPVMYYHRMMVPESPAEPDPEMYSICDPAIIPLEDVTGNPDTINDFQNTPWPEPKGQAPPTMMTAPMSPFSSVPPMMPFPPRPGMPFPMARFPGPMPFPSRPNADTVPTMSPDMMMNGGMFPPHIDGAPDGNMMQMNNFRPPFGPPFSAPSGFPGNRPVMRQMPNVGNMGNMANMGNMGNMGGPRGPMPPNPGWYRGPGGGGPMGPSGPGPGGPGPAWQSGPRKGWNPRVCRQFYRKGFCNKGDNCLFLHPGVNCPPL